MAINYAAVDNGGVLIVSNDLVARRNGKPLRGDCISVPDWRAHELVDSGEYLYAVVNTVYKTPGGGAVENTGPNTVQIYVYSDEYRRI